ncbi:MAG: molybdenum cofactor guanylyltransferase [Planctomycetes bacterium]|nr:molybdenum cofactor guanylyltransferase [Planctomycetota bacterium]
MPSTLKPLAGIVLCGGKSVRMGRPKAWLPFGEEVLLQRMVRIVRSAAEPVRVAGHAGQALPPLPQDIQVVHDAVVDGGPLAGIAAGMAALTGIADAAFVTSCDHPLLRPALIERLLELLVADRAVVPVQDGQLFPLTAIYRVDTLPLAEALLMQGEGRVHRFAEACGARHVEPCEFAAADPACQSLRNVNDPRAYAEALRMAGFADASREF